MKRVVIHIGLPKTGTTSIQAFLRANADALREQGVVYPGMREHPLLETRASHTIFLNAVAGRPLVAGTTPEQCREAIETAFDSFRKDEAAKTLIWSHEGLSMALHRLDWAYLAGLLEELEVTFLIYTRFTDHLMEALYHQNIWERATPIREHQYDVPLQTAEARMRIMPHLSLVAQRQTIRRGLPAAGIKFRSYDRVNAKSKLLSDALVGCGVNLVGRLADPDASTPRRNRSNPTAHTMLLYQLQMAGADFQMIRDIAEALQKRRDTEPIAVESKTFRFLGEAAMLKARAQYRRDRDRFPKLPAQPFPAQAAAETELTREEAVAILQSFRPLISDELFERACAILT